MANFEVELKFTPTQEQKDKLISGATLLGTVHNHDTYFDYADFRLLKKDVRFRNRNGKFELKVRSLYKGCEEIEDVEEIKKYFNTELSLDEFINKDLVKIMEYNTEREKYKKGIFEIDIDHCDFGFELCEIELMVKNESEISEAREKIKQFAGEFGMEKAKEKTKALEYLKRFNPQVYEEIHAMTEIRKMKIK